MAQREFIEAIRLSGAPQAVEIYGEVGEPSEGLAGSNYTGYQARCGCGVEEHFTREASGLRRRSAGSAAPDKRTHYLRRRLGGVQPDQGGPARAKALPLLGQGYGFPLRPPGPEVIP